MFSLSSIFGKNSSTKSKKTKTKSKSKKTKTRSKSKKTKKMKGG